jgi:DNA sulfur modification protein DndD
MRLLEITLTDFGVFQGKNTFDLRPSDGPIVIFGGKNGAGKTTLLDGIRLCLYGPLFFTQRTSRKDYEGFLASKFHRRRDALVPINHASASLRFEYAQMGYRHEYEVTRAWKRKGNSIIEQLIVKQDGKHLSDMAEDRWQDFIDELIPVGVANLFFFDGEKIQSLASDSLGGQILGNEIKRLLGLSVIEQLQLDLDVYLYRQRKDGSMPELTLRVEESQKNRETSEEDYQNARQDRSQTETYLFHLRGKIEDIEQRISRDSSGFGAEREALKGELSRIQAELLQTEREIHDVTSGLLPFALVPDLCQQLKMQLITESEYQQWEASQNIMTPRLKDIRKSLDDEALWRSGNQVAVGEIKSHVSKLINNLLDGLLVPPDKFTNIKLRHQIAEPERLQLLGWIDQATTNVPKKLKQLGEHLENLEQERLGIESKLRKVPADAVLKPLMDELNQLHQRLGELQLLAEQQEKKLLSSNNRRQEAQRQLLKAYDDLRGGEALDKRLQLVIKVHDALGSFLQNLTREKLARLEELVAKRFNEIIQKADLVQRVSIDPNNYHITVYDTQGKEIPKEGLSAGEKQMFAIATLWALRQLSARPFPVVIDTPLGRLDREHRDSLVENYFPFISHQVILFSTDTEVDQNYFRDLSPYISHAYHLIYNPERGATDYQQGYFWGGSEYAA